MNQIQPAQRLESVKEYYFSAKLKEIADMNSRGLKVISLGVGSPDSAPDTSVVEKLCSVAREKDAHGYQPYMGIKELREAFARWYETYFGVRLDPSGELLPLIGSKEGILHISLAFLNPGDGVLVPNPGYPSYTSVSRLLGATVKSYKLDPQRAWAPDFEALEQMDLSGVKLMWVNYPNMPTGARGSLALFERLVHFAQKRGIVVVNDNPYSFILNEERLSILRIPGAKEFCIELNSLSKSHNMPGWRMGVLASNANFVEWVLRVKSNIDSGQFKAMQLAAASALNLPEDWHREYNCRLYRRRRAYAEEIMQLLACSYDPDQTGMFLWGKVPEAYRDAAELADKLLYEAGVFVTPGFIFGTAGEKYIRISLCASEEKLAEALERIGKLTTKA